VEQSAETEASRDRRRYSPSGGGVTSRGHPALGRRDDMLPEFQTLFAISCDSTNGYESLTMERRWVS
jgi:hypothetical protein